MANRIHLLDTLTANQIAAGEVVERPLSVIKELVENAIDAAATRIDVKIFDAACEKLQVTDNGVGMSPEDMLLSVKRHATSKLRTLDDLQTLFTLGFRGEALPSIAAVSCVTITSKQAANTLGYTMRVEEGKPAIPEETGSRDGTTVLVDRLFYNAPARKKFLKSARWELGLISDCLQKLALSHPQIAFKLVQGSKTLFASDGGGDLARAVLAVYGPEVLGGLVNLDYVGNGVTIGGFTSLPDLNRANRNYYTFFVNGRWVRSRELSAMVDEAYRTLLPERRYPLVVLNLRLPEAGIDVNVHPAKMEIKFQQPAAIKEAVRAAIQQALLHQEVLSPRLQTPSLPQPARLPVDENSGFIRLEESRGVRLREAAAIGLDGKTLAQRLYGEGRPQRLPVAEEQQLDFEQLLRDDSHIVPPQTAPAKMRYTSLQVLGQAEGSFIVAVGADGLYLIDQHAAHERVLYEHIAAEAAESGGGSRMLAIPQTLQLTVQEHIWLTEGILHIDKLGFIVEHFGENTYILRGVPLWYEGGEPAELLRALLESLAHEKGDLKRLRTEELFMAACKQAVKANSYLSSTDISALVSSLDKCENSATCPHGRPIAVKISFAEIRKRFLRNIT